MSSTLKGVIMSEYVLQVGNKGFDRLKFINDIFGEHSRNFLRRSGLTEGLRVLELGCGTGSMTTWIANAVGNGGQVVAVDASEKQIEIVRNAIEESGATNIEFIRSTVETLEVPDESIDLIYSRLLLMHLKNPVHVLARLRKYLRPGGVICCEEPHASSLITTPRNDSIERLNNLFIELGKLQGLDFNIGEKLLPILKTAGYSQLHACFVQPVISMAEAVDFVQMGAIEVAPFAIKYGMVSEVETEKMLHELAISEFDGDSYYIFPRQAQVFGHT